MSRFSDGCEWPIVTYMAVTHAGALVLCVAFPSALAVEVAALLYVVTGCGITIGYHRLLAHASFACAAPFEKGWALLGLLAGEGPPLFWVACHRRHHAFSDEPGDPHSPAETFAWAHWLWLFPKYKRHELGRDYVRWAPKLAQQPFYRWLEARYLWIQAGFGVALFGAGYALGGRYMAFSFLGYAYFLRMVLVLHATWLVNSLSHTAGYCNYQTGDASKNNPFVAAVALGEGWHNNHHHVQAAANHGHRRWELDVSFAVIVSLAALGLARDVKVYSARANRLERWFA